MRLWLVTTPEASGYTSVALPDGNSYADYNTATRFTFDSPVYVQDGARICIRYSVRFK